VYVRHRNPSNRSSRPIVTAPPLETKPATPARPKPTRAQRVVAFTFLGAFALTMLTVVYTGLYVRSPNARRAPETPAVALTIGEPRTINLVFASRAALAGVEFTVDLPAGVEIADHPGQRRVELRAALAAGDNALPLTLVALNGPGGQLAARLRHRDGQKVFVVDVTVGPP
jgi:hypothetical protein